jgi:hypothetical protein
MEKVWRLPQLIVLVSGKPEEAVLSACKTDLPVSAGLAGNGSPSAANNLCTVVPAGPGVGRLCGPCNTATLS